MFNLLPIEKKRTIAREYHLRLSALFLLMLFVTGIVAIVFLAPSFFAVGVKKNRASQELKNLQIATPELRSVEELEALVLEIRNKLEVLKPQEVLLPSQLIQKILDNRPKGVSITASSYLVKEGEINLKVTGKGSTREALTSFARNLREDEAFQSVDLPVSDLARDRDIDFSIALVVNL